MKYENEIFHRLFDRGERLRLEDIELNRCTFSDCGISLTTALDQMAKVRRVSMTDCTIDSVFTGPLIASEVNIANLRTSDLFILWCPYLDRVTLAGNIGRMKINATADPSTSRNEKQKPFEEFRREFYANVEWALDISNARFKEFDLDGVPACLVRRDPESQIVVTRERALEIATPGWDQKLNPQNRFYHFTINLFLSDGLPDMVLVAPLGAAKAERDEALRGLQELRDIGLAEPD